MSETYDGLWSQTYKKCFKECFEKGNPILSFAVGETHTYACTLQGKGNHLFIYP
jgi:myosin-5